MDNRHKAVVVPAKAGVRGDYEHIFQAFSDFRKAK